MCNPQCVIFTYIDDILVASETNEQHKQHLEIIFERLRRWYDQGKTVFRPRTRTWPPRIEVRGKKDVDVSEDKIESLKYLVNKHLKRLCCVPEKIVFFLGNLVIRPN